RVVLATGARWRKDGVGRTHLRPVPGSDAANVFTPEDVFAGAAIPGPVVVFDDDHAYMGGVIAEELRRRGLDVTLVTSAGVVSAWTEAGQEQHFIQARILEAGIAAIVGHCLNPGLIAAAVHSGHRYARELDAAPAADLPFRVEQIAHESRTA